MGVIWNEMKWEGVSDRERTCTGDSEERRRLLGGLWEGVVWCGVEWEHKRVMVVMVTTQGSEL